MSVGAEDILSAAAEWFGAVDGLDAARKRDQEYSDPPHLISQREKVTTAGKAFTDSLAAFVDKRIQWALAVRDANTRGA